MNSTPPHDPQGGLGSDDGVASMIDYIIISGILMCLFVILLLLVNTHFMQGPADAITSSSFTDVGNGVSTRMVDTYVIAPENGNISSAFDIPDYIAGSSYSVEILGDSAAQRVTVSRGGISTSIALAGIGSSRAAGGNTTGSGVNRISYSSEGYL